MMAVRSAAQETHLADRSAISEQTNALQAEVDRVCVLWEAIERCAI